MPPLIEILVLAAFSIKLTQMISLILHEFSHALVGWAAGYRIKEIRIGKEPNLLTIRWRETTLCIGNIWQGGGGWVLLYPTFSRNRCAELSFIAAGPAMNILLIGLLILLCSRYFETPAAGIASLAAIYILLSQTLRGLWPQKINLYGRTMPNDGLLIWQILRGRTAPSKELETLYINAITQYWDGQDPRPHLLPHAERIADHLLFDCRESPAWFNDERIAALERELNRNLQVAEKLFVLDALVTYALYSRDPRYIEQLDRWTSQALALNPTLPTLKGSRGAALVQMGRCDEALAFLAEANDTNDFDIMLNHAFKAQALFLKSDRTAAHAAFAVAWEVSARAGLREKKLAWNMIERIGTEIGFAMTSKDEPVRKDAEDAAVLPIIATNLKSESANPA